MIGRDSKTRKTIDRRTARACIVVIGTDWDLLSSFERDLIGSIYSAATASCLDQVRLLIEDGGADIVVLELSPKGEHTFKDLIELNSFS